MQIDFQDLISHISDGLYLVDTQRKIIYWNKQAELITGYAGGEVIGHACYENILVHVDQNGQCLCRAMCPLASTITDGTLALASDDPLSLVKRADSLLYQSKEQGRNRCSFD